MWVREYCSYRASCMWKKGYCSVVLQCTKWIKWRRKGNITTCAPRSSKSRKYQNGQDLVFIFMQDILMIQEFLLTAVNRMPPFEEWFICWRNKDRDKRMSASSRGTRQTCTGSTQEVEIKYTLLSSAEQHTQALCSLPGKHVWSGSFSLLITPPWYLKNRQEADGELNEFQAGIAVLLVFYEYLTKSHATCNGNG